MKKFQASLTDVKGDAFQRIRLLRAAVFVSLLIAAVVASTLSYITFSNSEESFALQQYDSIAVLVKVVAVDTLGRMSLGTTLLAQAAAFDSPEYAEWPETTFNGFYRTVTSLSELSALDTMSIVPIVQPNETESFNRFFLDYAAEHSDIFPPGSGALGIWAPNPDPSAVPPVYQDTTGVTLLYPSPNTFLTPAMQYLLSESSGIGPENYGMNLHALPFAGTMMDAVYECVNNAPNFTYAFETCGRVSDVETLPPITPDNPDPEPTDASISFMQPIMTNLNVSQVVGFAASSANWKTVFSDMLPDFVDGVDCVIATDSTTFTYRIEGGKPTFSGLGDLHDEEFNKYAHRVDMLHEVNLHGLSAVKLTIYPSSDFINVYRTNTPLITSIGGAALILFCSLVFLAYDLTVHSEADRKDHYIDSRRKFVRFVSHEIRTPLNTVKLGLKLFDMEIEELIEQVEKEGTFAELQNLVRQTFGGWKLLVDDVLGNSESAVDVVNELLNYDKIESGTLRLDFSTVSIWEVARKVVMSFALQARQKAIDLQLRGGLWEEESLSETDKVEYGQQVVVGDATRIAQILRNLLSNALKFTPDNGTVVVTGEWVKDGLPDMKLAVPLDQQQLLANPRAGALRISVKDSGAGLTPEQLQEIGKEGVQFNANKLQAGGGSGLGLFICIGLVNHHGGTLNITSEGEGCGATFAVELPLFRQPLVVKKGAGKRRSTKNENKVYPIANLPTSREGSGREDGSDKEGHVDVDQQQGNDNESDRYNQDAGENKRKNLLKRSFQAQAEEEEEDEEDVRPKRVLVVDDAVSNRKLLTRILERKGYVCEMAKNGQVAIDMFEAMRAKDEPPDAIVMDFEMPVMDGPTATKHLRELGCACFITGVTGNVSQDDINHFVGHGANTVIAKPLDIDLFEQLLHAFLEKQTLDREAEAHVNRTDNPTGNNISSGVEVLVAEQLGMQKYQPVPLLEPIGDPNNNV